MHPGFQNPWGPLWACLLRGSLRCPESGPGAALTSTIVKDYAAPLTSLSKAQLSHPWPHVHVHTASSLWVGGCAEAVFPLLQAFAKISRQGLMNPKDLWQSNFRHCVPQGWGNIWGATECISGIHPQAAGITLFFATCKIIPVLYLSW